MEQVNTYPLRDLTFRWSWRFSPVFLCSFIAASPLACLSIACQAFTDFKGVALILVAIVQFIQQSFILAVVSVFMVKVPNFLL